ncbi:MAG: ribbon-helix-helix protein, CopG family [Rubrobacter sp.]|jgi:Arc/MetJ-type ribon-helix-helix transcriptional regulator|nr:ribbon-helix-helix protein, CopG family [Rubrobacter sp.]
MVRTQIYLTEGEQEALRSLARDTGRTQSELIREAIDAMLERQKPVDRGAVMRRARGIWSDRTDLPDFRELRDELDRAVEGT